MVPQDPAQPFGSSILLPGIRHHILMTSPLQQLLGANRASQTARITMDYYIPNQAASSQSLGDLGVKIPNNWGKQKPTRPTHQPSRHRGTSLFGRPFRPSSYQRPRWGGRKLSSVGEFPALAGTRERTPQCCIELNCCVTPRKMKRYSSLWYLSVFLGGCSIRYLNHNYSFGKRCKNMRQNSTKTDKILRLRKVNVLGAVVLIVQYQVYVAGI